MGFTKEEQQIAVRRITADKEIWLKFMVQEEIGINPGMIDNPYEIGLISAGSFLVGALPAILPFFLFKTVSGAMVASAVSVLAFLFLLGAIKARVTKINWLFSGLETLLFGVLSCGVGFLLGRFAHGFFK